LGEDGKLAFPLEQLTDEIRRRRRSHDPTIVRSAMGGMRVSLNSVGAITLFVEDPQRSKSFYQDVFGAPTIFEDENSAVVKFDNTIINLLKTPEAHDLIAPAKVAGPDSGSRFQFSVW